jgi:hypothetical protein
MRHHTAHPAIPPASKLFNRYSPLFLSTLRAPPSRISCGRCFSFACCTGTMASPSVGHSGGWRSVSSDIVDGRPRACDALGLMVSAATAGSSWRRRTAGIRSSDYRDMRTLDVDGRVTAVCCGARRAWIRKRKELYRGNDDVLLRRPINFSTEVLPR